MARDTGRSTLAGIAAEAGVSVSAVSKVLNGRTDVAAGDPDPDRRAAPARRLPGRLPARLRRRGPADRQPAHPVGRGTAARHGPGRGRGRGQRRGQHRGLTRRVHRLAEPGHGPGHRRRAAGAEPAGQQRAAAAGGRAHPAGGDRPAGGAGPGHPVRGHHQLAGLPDRHPAPDRAGSPPHRDHRRPGAPVVEPRPAGRLPRGAGGGRAARAGRRSSAGTSSARRAAGGRPGTCSRWRSRPPRSWPATTPRRSGCCRRSASGGCGPRSTSAWSGSTTSRSPHGPLPRSRLSASLSRPWPRPPSGCCTPAGTAGAGPHHIELATTLVIRESTGAAARGYINVISAV